MNRYPLVERVSSPLAAPEVFELIKDRPYSFFLDSGMDHRKLGRYSFMGSNPFLVVKSHGSDITFISGDEQEIQHGNPFGALTRALKMYKLDPGPATVPFLGGAVGYFSYDLCNFIEQLPSTAINDLAIPESYFAFYDTILAFDYQEGRAYIVATGFPELEEGRRLKQAKMRLEEMKNWLYFALPSKRSEGPPLPRRETLTPALSLQGKEKGEGENQPAEEEGEVSLKSNFTRDEYIKAVSKIREYIAAGDVFQVNLSQRCETDLTVPPYELYRRLRQINPAPFASYFNFDGITIVSASPERFLHVDGDWVETRPIKGTRPRGKSEVEDAMLAQELLNSVKDRAENVMIVDLERNDLGRVCQYGTVEVTEMAILETFPTVFHLTSTVIGKLRPDKDRIDLLKASFPGGSITGAPKVRAMEIIDELEPTRRSVYTGAIGYLSFGGDMDLNIAIRTFLVKDGRAYFQVGGGIVYDSEPEAEYQETLDKAKALVQALKLSSKVAV